ncbi:Acyl-CoA N-acyltransferase [Hyaloscypha variabilis]
MLFNNLFSSKCLAYRALENTEGDNELLTKSIFSDPNMYAQFYDFFITPPSSNFIHNLIRDYWTNRVLSVTICLPSSGESPAACSNPVPIGWLSVVAPKSSLHHRSCTLSITVYSPHQGKGYGTEAINWALDWAFRVAGMHCVFNKGALQLYERIGFVHKGIERESYYHDFKWHDTIHLSMLENEYIASRAPKT